MTKVMKTNFLESACNCDGNIQASFDEFPGLLTDFEKDFFAGLTQEQLIAVRDINRLARAHFTQDESRRIQRFV